MTITGVTMGFGDREVNLMHENAITAADFLKALAHGTEIIKGAFRKLTVGGEKAFSGKKAFSFCFL